jgi:hypothetical protein
MNCWACSKSASSYTSGTWRDEISQSLDNLTSAWLPDTHYVYGDKLEELGMCDTRTIMHQQRFFYSNNELDPKIYQVTKVTDLNPMGVIKLSIKQDDFNRDTDNVELQICDYYSNEGEIRVELPTNIIANDNLTSEIYRLFINGDGELEQDDSKDQSTLVIGESSYYGVSFSDTNINPQWRITLNGENTSDENNEYYEGLFKTIQFDSSTISIKPSKASSLIGKQFTLSVCNEDGDYYSSIGLEVTE